MKFTELFKRKKKDVSERTSPRIITILCPNCGKEHSVQYRKAKSYYLDGTPQDLEAGLAMYVICDCGCLCHENMWQSTGLAQYIAQPEYQAVLHGNYTDLERKLRLLTFFPGFNTCAEVWLTHVASPETQHESIVRAIERLTELEPQLPEMWLDRFIIGIYMPQFNWKWECHISVALQKADLYRRIGEFDKATALLRQEALQWPNDAHTQEYISFQEGLISNNDCAAW